MNLVFFGGKTGFVILGVDVVGDESEGIRVLVVKKGVLAVRVRAKPSISEIDE